MNCPLCDSKLEASAKVYLDVELDDDKRVTSVGFSSTNDTIDGHPVAWSMGEMRISCVDYGHELADWDAGVLAERGTVNG